jgi:UDP-2,3-diacylglucosamine hydrolase
MPSTIVIADLHLSETTPEITKCFIQFLQKNAGKHEALYILGDLFESWIGDDDNSDFHNLIAAAIRQFSRTCPVYFIHGNRDFLLGKKYAQKAGMILLPESQQAELYGKRILFMHGDQLCLDDVDYQKFRRKSRTWWWKFIFTSLPLKLRKKTVENYRAQSVEAQKSKSLDIMDVAQREVDRVVAKAKCDWLIHGHTHRPAIHDLAQTNSHTQQVDAAILQDKSGPLRMVVGDWYAQGSVLELNENGYKLQSLPF